MSNDNPLVEYLKNYPLEDKFPDHKIYKWGSWGDPLATDPGDLDICFVGPIDRDFYLKVHHFLALEKANEIYIDQFMDITILPDETLFSHIERFNNCTDDKYIFDEEIIRYKLHAYNNDNEAEGREVEDTDLGFLKVKQIFAKKEKYQLRDWPQPILLKEFLDDE